MINVRLKSETVLNMEQIQGLMELMELVKSKIIFKSKKQVYFTDNYIYYYRLYYKNDIFIDNIVKRD